MAMRYLTKEEKDLAHEVFLASLPWNKIRVTDHFGLGDTKYTMGRTINVGPHLYSGMDIVDPDTYIHELVHVWQSEHSGYAAAYIFDSVAARMIHGQDAYKYPQNVAKPWKGYNAEQQAQIVEDWYHGGMMEKDYRFPFIRDIIRAKHVDPDQAESSSLPEFKSSDD